MDQVKAKSKVTVTKLPPAAAGQKRRRARAAPSSRKRKHSAIVDSESEEETIEEVLAFQQPASITGATLKPYQLEGVAWMVSLYESGISGILADEMGLGKTLQTIAFHAYLREKTFSPFLIVCPLSVLHNWVDEFAKFAPSIPVCMYHGTPAERAELRRTVMRPVEDEDDKKTSDVKSPAPKRRKVSYKKKKKPAKPTRRGARRKARAATPPVESEDDNDDDDDGDYKDNDDEEDEQWDEDEPIEVPRRKEKQDTQPPSTFPVVITTYEMIIKDAPHLSKYNWGYIVVDEGHRLKNFDCKLMQEIKKYSSAGRMILTGTPLHNNLAELWSLLNFILPDIFGDLDSFQSWFNLPQMQADLEQSRSTDIINALHAILKPFLLRRLKVDVEHSLPPKKEYALYAPLTERQKSVYSAVLEGGIRRFLINGKQKAEQVSIDRKREERRKEMMTEGRKLREKGKKVYDVDGDDDEYFEKLESGEFDRKSGREKEAAELGQDYHYRAAVKQINNLKLQNTVMQLRKVCSHPFLFDWPADRNGDLIVDEQLVSASGKMMVLERLLDELFRRGHKVLLFSQFTTMLDIIEAWAEEHKRWAFCRIDGSTAPLERREQMNLFQNGGNKPGAPCLFLLSTRAGGLGINLTAADTVIFYDQDWNPQMDVQAQDRAHRIGQTKPVLVFRLLSAHTIETKIMQRATQKRQLEALVIAKGTFKVPGSLKPRGKETMAELAASLLKLDGEKIEVVPSTAAGKASVLSDEDLNVLLDRSPEVFEKRGAGWTSKREGEKAESKPAFEVVEVGPDDGNDVLANMMYEEDA
ncbi:hypothetical protein BD410DRAFT_793521 [Rickenella mellea]|uniref:SNF2 family DNA-dependent ATPase n=1 Tax=Rickenella mellea TaxID=50990 RepID=A0A4Y7PT25_9AGAM|nr:hypothetical protein BD410DRAFT_793521 [Rickenella mellea]